jgi:hypothetical protein
MIQSIGGYIYKINQTELHATSILIQLEEQRCIYKIKNIVRQIK